MCDVRAALCAHRIRGGMLQARGEREGERDRGEPERGKREEDEKTKTVDRKERESRRRSVV